MKNFEFQNSEVAVSSLCFSMFEVQIWCLYLVNRLLYGVLPETTFFDKNCRTWPQFDHHNFWPWVTSGKFFQRMQLMPGEVLKISKRYSQPNLSYWRKTTSGEPFAPPPPHQVAGCAVNRVSTYIILLFILCVSVIYSQIYLLKTCAILGYFYNVPYWGGGGAIHSHPLPTPKPLVRFSKFKSRMIALENLSKKNKSW